MLVLGGEERFPRGHFCFSAAQFERMEGSIGQRKKKGSIEAFEEGSQPRRKKLKAFGAGTGEGMGETYFLTRFCGKQKASL